MHSATPAQPLNIVSTGERTNGERGSHCVLCAVLIGYSLLSTRELEMPGRIEYSVAVPGPVQHSYEFELCSRGEL